MNTCPRSEIKKNLSPHKKNNTSQGVFFYAFAGYLVGAFNLGVRYVEEASLQKPLWRDKEDVFSLLLSPLPDRVGTMDGLL